jgi:AraC-like DNA-binding protein
LQFVTFYHKLSSKENFLSSISLFVVRSLPANVITPRRFAPGIIRPTPRTSRIAHYPASLRSWDNSTNVSSVTSLALNECHYIFPKSEKHCKIRSMSEKFHIRSKSSLGVLRSINNVAVFVRVAGEYGIDPQKILAGSGIKMNELDDPLRIITTEQEIMVGRRLAQLAPVPWMGLELGKHHHLISKGKLGMAAICCATGLDAIKLVFSYIDLVSTYLQYDITIEGKKGYVRIRKLTNIKEFQNFIFETELVSLHTICAMVLDDVHVFKEINLAYPAPDYADKYEGIFHCPIKFNAPENLLIFEAAILDRPLKHANPLTRKILEQECRQLCQRLNENVSVKDKIRHELLFLEGEYPTLDQLAHRINMPERTIRRRLTAEGTSYKDILSDIRKQKALELIANGDLSMEKIAEKLGYSEVASFYHAFKTWTGTTPANYRNRRIK